MNWIPKILPADVIVSPFDGIFDTLREGNIYSILLLLIALLPIVAIIVIIVIAVRRSKKRKTKDEEKADHGTNTFPWDK